MPQTRRSPLVPSQLFARMTPMQVSPLDGYPDAAGYCQVVWTKRVRSVPAADSRMVGRMVRSTIPQWSARSSQQQSAVMTHGILGTWLASSEWNADKLSVITVWHVLVLP